VKVLLAFLAMIGVIGGVVYVYGGELWSYLTNLSAGMTMVVAFFLIFITLLIGRKRRGLTPTISA